LLFLFLAASSLGQAAATEDQSATPGQSSLLARRYTDGEKLTYHMKGSNEGWHYDVQAEGVVKKDSDGTYLEEYGWSNFTSNRNIALTPTSLNFRQHVSLAPAYRVSIPDLTRVQPALIGPITDWLTFYSDLRLAMSQNLSDLGGHAYVKYGRPSSWADGSHTLVGEDSIDFDITLKEVDAANRVATLLVRHVPPVNPEIKLPADWMRAPVADTPNNWIEVEKSDDGKYTAEVGKETFGVEMKVSLAHGKILSGTIDNPVEALTRECSDAALMMCSEPVRHQIRREIQIALQP
jgi:hypothetical protein